jgi:hypothetical protein
MYSMEGFEYVFRTLQVGGVHSPELGGEASSFALAPCFCPAHVEVPPPKRSRENGRHAGILRSAKT